MVTRKENGHQKLVTGKKNGHQILVTRKKNRHQILVTVKNSFGQFCLLGMQELRPVIPDIGQDDGQGPLASVKQYVCVHQAIGTWYRV